MMVTKLLSHYWTSDEHPLARQAQVEDWIDDLVEFGTAIVQDACNTWRRTEHRRPLPADIRHLCIEERDRRLWHALPPPQPVPTQRQLDAAEARRLYAEIQEMRYARGHAYRTGNLHQWDAQNATNLANARARLQELWELEKVA